MRDTSTLRMPEHNAPAHEDGGNYWSPEKGIICRSSRVAGYAHMLPNGLLHCNRCGWITPEKVITTYSDETGNTYLTWDEYVAAETNGYVVVSTTSRPNTHPAVVGPWDNKDDARRAQARLRHKWKREVGPRYTVKTYVRILHRETV